jgi:hypothetical protein
MPRLSLWKDGAHSSDYKFFDNRIREMFTVGGTGINVHKYLGPKDNSDGTDATKPNYINSTEQNIQDLLFVENRDRKYDPDVYNLRGVYQTADIDFDLSQFGLFLANDTLFMVFHLNDMVEMMGRKLMAGDVLELQHLKDYHSLDDSVPYALKRYYVIQDAARASEGFSPTWWPHLWRVKCTPLVDSQEYSDILDKIKAGEDTDDTLADVLSQCSKTMELNDAIITQAEAEVPQSGYDTTHLYTVPTREDGGPGDPEDIVGPDGSTLSAETVSPGKKIITYLQGDGIPPNGFPVSTGIIFPINPTKGDYVLRLDYFPNRLFKFDGKRWVKVEDVRRDNYTPGENTNLKGQFINNTANAQITLSEEVVSKQSLSDALKNRNR